MMIMVMSMMPCGVTLSSCQYQSSTTSIVHSTTTTRSATTRSFTYDEQQTTTFHRIGSSERIQWRDEECMVPFGSRSPVSSFLNTNTLSISGDYVVTVHWDLHYYTKSYCWHYHIHHHHHHVSFPLWPLGILPQEGVMSKSLPSELSISDNGIGLIPPPINVHHLFTRLSG
jgi:hypothetical protein